MYCFSIFIISGGIMKNILKITSLFLVLCLSAIALVSCAPLQIEQPDNPYLAKNIIIMIGDGMGLEHIEATKIFYGLNSLNMESLPYKGLVDTRADAAGTLVVTDSAAAGTALATGHKTMTGMVGMGVDWSLPLDQAAENPIIFSNVTELAISKGMKTGIVATKNLNDATPAAYSSHVLMRYMLDEVAVQQISSGIDVLMGAGYTDYYLPRIDSILGAGYQVCTTKNELLYANGDKIYAGFDSITPSSDVNLELMVTKALESLHNDNGFFAMFEGSKIDSGGHANNLEYVVSETLSFDIAIGIVINYIRLNPDTLLIVTADHETGGLSIPDGTTKEQLSNSMFSTGNHTTTPVPYFIWGPGADRIPDNIDNTDIAKIIARAMGKTLP